MKNSIKLTALLLLASVSVFAAAPVAAKAAAVPPANTVTFSSLPSLKGLEISVSSIAPAKAVVIVSDAGQNVIFKDKMPAYKSMEKGYILNQLADGDYTIEVIANHHSVTKAIHVYEADGAKQFFVVQ